MTPSGLIIGIILKIKYYLNLDAEGCSDNKNLIIPAIVKDDVVYEGCALAIKTMPIFLNLLLVR